MDLFSVRTLAAPFVKFESCCRHYRPLRQEFKSFPTLYYDSAPGTCPFFPPKIGGKTGAPSNQEDVYERGEAEERDIPGRSIDNVHIIFLRETFF